MSDITMVGLGAMGTALARQPPPGRSVSKLRDAIDLARKACNE